MQGQVQSNIIDSICLLLQTRSLRAIMVCESFYYCKHSCIVSKCTSCLYGGQTLLIAYSPAAHGFTHASDGSHDHCVRVHLPCDMPGKGFPTQQHIKTQCTNPFNLC